MRILVIESCVYEGSAWLEGWEGEAPVEVAEALVRFGKAREVWEMEDSGRTAVRPYEDGRVEKAVGKRERG